MYWICCVVCLFSFKYVSKGFIRIWKFIYKLSLWALAIVRPCIYINEWTTTMMMMLMMMIESLHTSTHVARVFKKKMWIEYEVDSKKTKPPPLLREEIRKNTTLRMCKRRSRRNKIKIQLKPNTERLKKRVKQEIQQQQQKKKKKQKILQNLLQNKVIS